MFEKLRNLKPEIVDINNPRRSPDPRLHGVTTRVTTKNVMNTRHDMDLLELYSKGKLKYQDIGKVCGNCVNWYNDPNLGRRPGGPIRGRCKARGFMQVHEELAADQRYNYTDPDTGSYFPEWPECPLYTDKVRLSRR